RIAAVDDRLHRETHHDNVAMFGFFEADDAATTAALLAEVEQWADRRGRSAVRGPLNPSLNESAGLLVDGFDADPMVLMPHNPREYGEFVEAAGYTKTRDLFAWLYELEPVVPATFARLAGRARERAAVSVRRLNLADFTREVERLRVIYGGAWDRNWGFVAP